ncbi:uncharacterized protein BJ171DRAFT_561416 [Polychytrium aggregatum]|uniref:uncharacterized protein n=1 Tax=Polychytrium aggregatum TaxID=110093 RepID=UPI0022FDFD71|nr:uncharacterized protein BJ171DRAFT_561416 [Polychytrium aggregatum]KAI9207587.1 hypothetical protein BJ171DRAFT_561416 [Polychytrium aggregatum]
MAATVQTLAPPKIRVHVFSMRIRLHDLFEDFDKLRSGYITAAQFRRCLGQVTDKAVVAPQSPLNEVEYAVLIKHYDIKQNGTVNWKMFVDSISTVVKPLLELQPQEQTVLKDVIERLRSYVKHHGSDVKSWFKDFDKHNNGYITVNQFRRGIPSNLISLEEEDMLLKQYSDEKKTVNYFKMNTDVNRKVKKPKPFYAQLVEKLHTKSDRDHTVPVGTEELLHAVTHEKIKPSVALTEERIMRQTQFRSGLRLASLTFLEEADIKSLISAYREHQGRIQYRKFCSRIIQVFTVDHLEKYPLFDVHPPPREYLVQGTNELSPEEEERCQHVIERLKTLMRERRFLLAPFFKDFDKYLGNIGRVTLSHFSRLLSSMKLDLSDSDLHIIFKKFEDREIGKINYMEFIRTIDPETYDQYHNRASRRRGSPAPSEESYSSHEVVTSESVMKQLKQHVASKRIRVAEFFKDFDKLRCYSIPKHEFIRGINRIGLSLTDEEYEALADRFIDSKKRGCCRWKAFEEEIERVFGETHLESRPAAVPQPEFIETDPFDTHHQMAQEELTKLATILSRFREHLRIRQSSIKPFFKDFDRLCTGHVTKVQFRQCLTYMKVDVTDEEFQILCKRYGVSGKGPNPKDPIKDGSERICYLMFLKESHLMHIKEWEEEMERLEKQQREKKPAHEINSLDILLRQKRQLSSLEIEKLLNRIKIKAKSERIRVIDFMEDFDHLRHGQITQNEFRRALKLLYSNLNEIELRTIEDLYKSESDPRMVNYVAFSDAIESVFTSKGLESDPLHCPADFDPLPDVEPMLLPDDKPVFDKVMDRLSERVAQRGIDVLSYLEDYDFVREGTITTNQFRAVLNGIALPVDDQEILALARHFTHDKNLDRINYRAFATMVTGSTKLNGRSSLW